jgi:1-acyl-sn-glycerol-3-phosphate acyltransferase
MGYRLYRAGCYAVRYIKQQCIREVVLHKHRALRHGGFIFACTHLGHVEPALVSTLIDRPIHWMARVEYYYNRWFGPIVQRVLAFPVNRFGVTASSIRKAVHLASTGRIVGIFPEGGCRVGKELAFRGGRIKQGVCVIAQRAGVPIVPVVVLGTHKMKEVDAWLTGKQTVVYIAFGNTIDPEPILNRRDRKAARKAMAQRLEAEYVRTYKELLEYAKLDDAYTP